MLNVWPNFRVTVILEHQQEATRTYYSLVSVVVRPPKNGLNGNEAVGGAASKAFDRWLHRRYASDELTSAEASRFAARYRV